MAGCFRIAARFPAGGNVELRDDGTARVSAIRTSAPAMYTVQRNWFAADRASGSTRSKSATGDTFTARAALRWFNGHRIGGHRGLAEADKQQSHGG